MNSQATDPDPAIDTQSKPLYQLAHLIAMLERQHEAKKASPARQQEGTR